MAALQPPTCAFGWKAEEFRLPGIDGLTHTLADVSGTHGLLIMFICNHCPYVKGAIDRIVADCRALQAEGIGCVAIMSNDTVTYPEDSFDNMKLFAVKHNFPFPYLIDETQDVARAYNAVCTPDFFGFNANLELQYRGRLDSAGMHAQPGAIRELLEGMRQVARTGVGPGEQTPSIGCSIKWRNAA